MNLCDERNVKKIMSMFSTGTKKSFGQNFLINPDVPYSIARESYEYHNQRNGAKKSAVIEIGPGIGSLTQELCENYDKVIAVEIDKTLIPVLEYTLAERFDALIRCAEQGIKCALCQARGRTVGNLFESYLTRLICRA